MTLLGIGDLRLGIGIGHGDWRLRIGDWAVALFRFIKLHLDSQIY